MTTRANSPLVSTWSAALSFVLRALSCYIFSATPSALAFQCGNDLKTYSVRSLGGIQGSGIRCVKSTNDGVSLTYPYFAWYGEGTWGEGRSYRHVGHAFVTALGLVGSASETFGNGESSNFTFNGNLFLVMVDNGIQVLGAWNEQWDLVDDAMYTPLPFALKTCGPNLKQFTWTCCGWGERFACVMQNADPVTTWISAGQNSPGHGYLHLGSKSTLTAAPYVTTDICALGDCNTSEWSIIPACGGGFLVEPGGTWTPDP